MTEAKNTKSQDFYEDSRQPIDAGQIIQKIIGFLQMFMCETLAKRIMGMVLISVGISNSRVTELTGICDKTVRTLKKSLETGKISELFHVGGGGGKGKLIDIEDAVIEEINKNNYHSRQQIADMVYDKFGIKVSVDVIGRLLKKKGIKWLKCGSLPAKAEPAKQRLFYDTILYLLMSLARQGTVDLFFLDASHFVMGCDYLGYIYGTTRRYIRTYSGRKRYNVLGALNFVSKRVTTITNDTYITATQICELLKKIASEHAGRPIFIILDNARYQKCAIVKELAGHLGIYLIYIPPYSPNLNLIERLWKHVKGRLRTKYYDKFDEFKERIDSIVSSTDKEDKALIDRLIGEKVQLFDEPTAANTITICKPVSTKMAA